MVIEFAERQRSQTLAQTTCNLDLFGKWRKNLEIRSRGVTPCEKMTTSTNQNCFPECHWKISNLPIVLTFKLLFYSFKLAVSCRFERCGLAFRDIVIWPTGRTMRESEWTYNSACHRVQTDNEELYHCRSASQMNVAWHSEGLWSLYSFFYNLSRLKPVRYFHVNHD